MSFKISSFNGNLGRLMNTVSINSSIPSIPPSPSLEEIPKHWVSDWFEILLKKVAQNNLGPTVTTRWLFLSANCLYNSYQYITENKTPVDNQYWQSMKKGDIKKDISDIESFIEVSCRYFFPKIIRDYMNLSFNDEEVQSIINKHNINNINNINIDELKNLINIYLSGRDNDGWKNTFIFKGDLPNGNSYISADNKEDQDLNTLKDLNKWTPLKIDNKIKNYLTPEWGTANNGILNNDIFLNLLSETNKLFPKTESQYEKEMKDVFELTKNLTDEQKIIAEFWAGGPGTVTPPGMWVVFMDIVIRSNSIKLVNEIKNYTILCSGLYESSILAWRLKRDNLQARPIQKIRQYFYNEPISEPWNTNENNNKGQFWLPYQELSFVTPPFPDFVSGHSTFSSSSAKLFCYLLGTDLINLQNPVINNDILNYLCPQLNSVNNFSLNNFFILPGTSTVEKDIVPQTSINLNWVCWTEIARSSGRSRLYGGIHIESSNQGGLYLGSLIGDNIWNLLKDI
jgi:hypothetical protein